MFLNETKQANSPKAWTTCRWYLNTDRIYFWGYPDVETREDRDGVSTLRYTAGMLRKKTVFSFGMFTFLRRVSLRLIRCGRDLKEPTCNLTSLPIPSRYGRWIAGPDGADEGVMVADIKGQRLWSCGSIGNLREHMSDQTLPESIRMNLVA